MLVFVEGTAGCWSSTLFPVWPVLLSLACMALVWWKRWEEGCKMWSFTLNGRSARWWQCHSSSESCLHTGVYLLPCMEVSLSLPWAEGAAQPGPPGHQSCWGLWYWWKPGNIPAVLQGPSAAPGLWALPFPLTSMLMSFMKEPEEPTATHPWVTGEGQSGQNRQIECGICMEEFKSL